MLGLLLWWRPELAPLGMSLFSWLFWVILAATVLIIASGLQYVRMGFEILRRNAARRAHP